MEISNQNYLQVFEELYFSFREYESNFQRHNLCQVLLFRQNEQKVNF